MNLKDKKKYYHGKKIAKLESYEGILNLSNILCKVLKISDKKRQAVEIKFEDVGHAKILYFRIIEGPVKADSFSKRNISVIRKGKNIKASIYLKKIIKKYRIILSGDSIIFRLDYGADIPFDSEADCHWENFRILIMQKAIY